MKGGFVAWLWWWVALTPPGLFCWATITVGNSTWVSSHYVHYGPGDQTLSAQVVVLSGYDACNPPSTVAGMIVVSQADKHTAVKFMIPIV
jgi:hypothetical protein